MTIRWICLILLAFSPLTAEMIGNVQYHLPAAAQNWKVVNELKNEKSTTIIYIPSDKNKASAMEFFSAHTNTLPLNTDGSSLKTALSMQFPNTDLKVNILSKDASSVLYEWSASYKGQEVIHGWMRGFGSDKGTVLLGYYTELAFNVDQARKNWLPILEQAKQVD